MNTPISMFDQITAFTAVKKVDATPKQGKPKQALPKRPKGDIQKHIRGRKTFQSEILEYYANGDILSTTDIVKQYSYSLSRVADALRKLIDKDFLEFVEEEKIHRVIVKKYRITQLGRNELKYLGAKNDSHKIEADSLERASQT